MDGCGSRIRIGGHRLSLEGSWLVESLAVGGELVPPLDARPPLSLEVADRQVTGNSGVNRFTGSLASQKVFSALASTRMAGPEKLMAQEDIFLAHLESVEAVETSDSGILLLSDGLVVVALVPSGTGDAAPAS